MKYVIIALVLATPLRAQDIVDHSAFEVVLDQAWKDGLVDYARVASDRSGIDAYVAALGSVNPSTVEAASRSSKLAFWINAYNACTMTLVLDHYPIARRRGLGRIVNVVKGVPANSIQQIPDTWSTEFCSVAGSTRSLDEIEHSIIRPMGEPRIHFAINCAARSCPMLAPTPYLADSLEVQLDAAVRRLINEPRHFSFSREGRPTVHVNKVLDWFNDDFGGVDGVGEFFLQYLSAPDRAYVAEHGPLRVTFRDYDWTLNDTAVFGNDP
jgi:hypothetical protein